jgi:uncharacterized protein YerC
MNQRHPVRQSSILLALFVGGCLAAGCAGWPPPPPPPQPVFLTDAKSVTLLPTEALAGRLEMRQLMEARYGGQTFSIEAYVKADTASITMVALSVFFGTEIYSLTFRNAAIEYTAVSFAGALKPEYLVADFQFCYFPAEAVAAMLQAAGLSFTETKTGDGWVREIRDGERRIIAITRKGNTIEYANLLRGYGYTITEAAPGTLPPASPESPPESSP